MSPRSGTAQRLLLSFLALTGLYAVATYYALEGLVDIHQRMHRSGDDYTVAATAIGVEGLAWQHYARTLEPLTTGAAAAPATAARVTLDEAAEARWTRFLFAELRKHGGAAQRAYLDAAERDLAVLTSAHAPGAVLDAAERARLAEAVSGTRQRTRALVRQLAASLGEEEQHPDVTQHASFRRALAFLLATMILLVATGVYIHRTIARPLEQLEDAAQKLGAGDLDTPVTVRGPVEFSRLAAQLNAMTSALKDKQERLVHSERLASVGRLAAGVAHELNNPLGVILGYVRMLEHKASGPLADDLRIVGDEAVRCREIVEGLIDLSRPPRPEGGRIELGALCSEVVDRLGQTLALPRGGIHVEGDEVVTGSPARVRQALVNLVRNAVEAAGPGGRVSIRVRPSDDEQYVVTEIEDSGHGLAPEVRERLFEPFVTDKPSGTGLGLAVSQGIAQSHGGRIELFDAPGGTGALARLWLPRGGAT